MQILTIAHWSGILVLVNRSEKLTKTQKRCLRIVPDDYDSDYDVLLRKSGKVTMEIKRLRVLVIEIFKTVNNLNPNYMKDTFTPKLHPKVRPNDILAKHHNTITYGTKSLKSLGPKIWNRLPEDNKSETSYNKFKEYTDTWFGPKCRCNVCMNI